MAKRTLTFWTAVACLCGGPLAAQEKLEVHYTTKEGVSETIEAETVDFGGGYEAFLALSFEGIKSIRLPEGWTSLNVLHLQDNQLTSFTLSESWTSLNLNELDLSGNLLTNLTLPEGLTSLRRLVLWGIPSLTSLTIPKGLSNLRYLEPYNCQLTNLTLPDEWLPNLELLDLRRNQFTSFSLPESWTDLKDLTINLASNDSLTNLTLPEGLKSLGRLSLSHTQLTNLTLPEGLKSLGRLSLSGNQLTSLTLPEGLTYMDELWIEHNRQLTNLVLPEGLTGLRKLNLSGNQLTSLTLPKGVTNLTHLWFEEDDPLKVLTLPEGLNLNDFEELWLPRGTEISFYRPEFDPLKILRVESGLEISWESGVLQKSAGVEGPWEDVNASSPLRVSPSIPAEFFRVRAEGSSNPLPDPSLPTDPNPLPEPGSHPLPLNGSLEGSIDALGEEDEYQITVTDSGTLTVYSTGSMDLYGRLLDGSGNELASDDDGGEDTNFRISRSVSAGTYYVRVRHYDNSGTGNYGITSRFVEPSRLPLNGSLEESIDPVGEEDMYRITVTGSGQLTVYSTGSMDLYGHLLDSSGNELASNDDGGEDTNFRISHSVSAGTYYVRVRHYDNSGTGNYGITSRFE